MGFDRTKAADLAALKSEVNTDPLGMGYAAVIGNTLAVLNLLNDPANNVETPKPTGAAAISANRLLELIYPEAISSQDQFKLQLVFEGSSGLDADVSNFRTQIAGLSTALNNAIQAEVRDLSRAEVLFGGVDANGVYETVNINRDDWIAARES